MALQVWIESAKNLVTLKGDDHIREVIPSMLFSREVTSQEDVITFNCSDDLQAKTLAGTLHQLLTDEGFTVNANDPIDEIELIYPNRRDRLVS